MNKTQSAEYASRAHSRAKEELKVKSLAVYLASLPLGRSSTEAIQDVALLVWSELDEAIAEHEPAPEIISACLSEALEAEVDDILVGDWDRQEVADLVNAGMAKYKSESGVDCLDSELQERLLSEVHYYLERFALDGEIDDLDDAVTRASKEAYATLDDFAPNVMKEIRRAISA